MALDQLRALQSRASSARSEDIPAAAAASGGGGGGGWRRFAIRVGLSSAAVLPCPAALCLSLLTCSRFFTLTTLAFLGFSGWHPSLLPLRFFFFAG
jgi:hypothetical protein